MKIPKQEIKRIAEYSCLSLTEQDIVKLKGDFVNILRYIHVLSKKKVYNINHLNYKNYYRMCFRNDKYLKLRKNNILYNKMNINKGLVEVPLIIK